MGYILAVLGGFLFGVILTCILLAKRNLEMYTRISNKTEDSLKNNIALAKGAYNAYIKDYEGNDEVQSDDTLEETEDEYLEDEIETEDEGE